MMSYSNLIFATKIAVIYFEFVSTSLHNLGILTGKNTNGNTQMMCEQYASTIVGVEFLQLYVVSS